MVGGRIPPYQGRGRPPTHKLPGDDWQYLQMIKHRDKRGRLMEIEAKVVFGNKQAVRQLLGENTADAERNHLTMRHFNGRLVRKSLAFSKKVRMLAVSTAWDEHESVCGPPEPPLAASTPAPETKTPSVPTVQISLPGLLEGRKNLLEALRAQAGERLEYTVVAGNLGAAGRCQSRKIRRIASVSSGIPCSAVT